ncbi:MAG: substrate-binding domain-containing protein [Acetobacteraceae bacterium]|nr:substrate-binding domain-containing protein [Acetobacteraceae bacterium]
MHTLRLLARLILLALLAFAAPGAPASASPGETPPAATATLRIGGTGTLQGLVRMLFVAFRLRHPDVTLDQPRSLGSSGGIGAMLAGALDIAASSRALTQAERQAGADAILLGTTPFVFVTSHPTARASLTDADIVAIFTRQRTVWPDGMPIRLILRPEQDSDTAYLLDHFPGLGPGLDAVRRQQTIPIALTDQDNLDQAELRPGSFAGTSLVTVLSEHRRLTVLPLDGIDPSLDAMEHGAYTLTRPVYFVRGHTMPPATGAFLAFVASPDGARVLRRAGVSPAAAPP